MTEETEPQDDLSQAMKRDWDWRARENAKWFINTYKLDQTEAEFDETGRRDFERFVLSDLPLLTDGRHARQLRVLEIGCGTGRMSRHFAETFGEVHGVDVSGEMIHQATERLKQYPTLHFHETSGVDFSAFPDESFDLVFSSNVFQHLPDSELVRSNIGDAFRCLRTRGILKFQTNGVTNSVFAKTPKDTWTGAGFSELDVRNLAMKIGAQLVEIRGRNTQYCWSVLRKTDRLTRSPDLPFVRIVACGSLDEPNELLKIDDSEVLLTLIITGVESDEIDSNNLEIEFDGQRMSTCHVAPSRLTQPEHSTGHVSESDIRVDVVIPMPELIERPRLRVVIDGHVASDFTATHLPGPKEITPRIHLVTNVIDGGLDIEAHGPKSLIRLFVHDLGDSTDIESVRVVVGDRVLQPAGIVFLPVNGTWEVTAQLPADTAPGQLNFAIRRGDIESPGVLVNVA